MPLNHDTGDGIVVIVTMTMKMIMMMMRCSWLHDSASSGDLRLDRQSA